MAAGADDSPDEVDGVGAEGVDGVVCGAGVVTVGVGVAAGGGVTTGGVQAWLVAGEGVVTVEQSKVMLQVRVWLPPDEQLPHAPQVHVSEVQAGGAAATSIDVFGPEENEPDASLQNTKATYTPSSANVYDFEAVPADNDMFPETWLLSM